MTFFSDTRMALGAFVARILIPSIWTFAARTSLALISPSVSSSDFSEANLEGCRFVRANVKTCDFRGANLRGTTFAGAAIELDDTSQALLRSLGMSVFA